MKKLGYFLFAISVIGAVAVAQTNVLSKNAVGYVRVDMPSNGMQFVRMDFDPLTGSNTVSEVVGDQLAAQSKLYAWDYTNQTWVTYGKTTKLGWGSASNLVMTRGQAYFLKSPVATNVFLMGQVPDSTNSYLVPVGEGLNAVGFSFPATTYWTNTAISKVLDSGDKLYVWDVASGYVIYGKTTKLGWGSATNLILQPGQGFFIRKGSVGTTNWSELKPYTWP